MHAVEAAAMEMEAATIETCGGGGSTKQWGWTEATTIATGEN